MPGSRHAALPLCLRYEGMRESIQNDSTVTLLDAMYFHVFTERALHPV